jgi:ATP-binding cassette, subfamily B, bacterial
MNKYPTLRKFILEIAYPYRRYFYGVFLIGIYTAVHGSLQPYVLKRMLDSAASTINTPGFIQACIIPASILVLMGFAITFIWRLYNYLILKSLPKMKADIVKLTTEYLRGHSFEFFQNQLSGALSAKVGDLTSNLQELINTAFNISRQGLAVIIAIAMSALVHPYFPVAFLASSIGFLYMAYYCSKSIQPYAKKFAESRSRNSGIIVDSLTNIANVLMFARERFESGYLNKSTEDTVAKDQSMQWKNMLNASILSGVAVLLQSVSIVLLVYLGSKGLITIGGFVFIFILSITVIDQIWFLTESLLSVGEKVGVCRQALETIFVEHQQEKLPDSKILIIQKGEIVFDNVNFAYSGCENLFEGMSATITGGKKIGLVGYSGGGKSTFVNLITRLFDIQQGKISIDSQLIDSVTRCSLRENIAFIPQDPSLFHRSLLENIQYGKLDASIDEVIQASKKAHAHEFIMKLPNEYNTLVGERGVKLSGGQRQRIAIARAILKNAPILILDEATSSLDSLTEEYIQESLHYAMTDKTVIVIAHRLSTVLAMDEIWVFDNGNILERGSHQELIKKNGFYKKLWDVQNGHSFI